MGCAEVVSGKTCAVGNPLSLTWAVLRLEQGLEIRRFWPAIRNVVLGGEHPVTRPIAECQSPRRLVPERNPG